MNREHKNSYQDENAPVDNALWFCELSVPNFKSGVFGTVSALALSLTGCANETVTLSPTKDENKSAQLSADTNNNPVITKVTSIDAVPSITPSAAVDEFLKWEGMKIQINCKPVFKSDESSSSLITKIEPVKTGDRVVMLPREVFSRKIEVHYEIPTPESANQKNLLIISNKHLGSNTTAIFGYLTDRGREIVFNCTSSTSEPIK